MILFCEVIGISKTNNYGEVRRIHLSVEEEGPMIILPKFVNFMARLLPQEITIVKENSSESLSILEGIVHVTTEGSNRVCKILTRDFK